MVDARGKAAAHADVVALWVEAPFKPERRIVRQKTSADAGGQFELPVSGSYVLLASRRGDEFSAPTIVFLARQARQETRLRLDLKPAVKLSGRVLNSEGKPLTHVTVEIRSRIPMPLALADSGEPFTFSGSPAIHTDADGRFTTPPVPLTGPFQATVTLQGRDIAKSEWLYPPAQGTGEFRQIVVAQRIAARGAVADRAGKPLAGATVALLVAGGRETATTDSKGTFEFSSVPDGPALLTIQHSDCRFYGEKLATVPSTIERRLTRLTEPSTGRMTEAPCLPRPERLRLAHRLFDPYRDRMLAKPVPINQLGLLATVGVDLDPRDVLRHLRKGGRRSSANGRQSSHTDCAFLGFGKH